MSGEEQDVRTMCGEGVRVELVTKGVERVVLSQIEMMEVSIPGLSQWSRQAKVKHLPMLAILQKSIKDR